MDSAIIKGDTGFCQKLKFQLLEWASHSGSCCFLDSQDYTSPFQQQGFLLGALPVDTFLWENAESLGKLDAFLQKHRGKYIFGHLAYELAAPLHGITSPKTDSVGFAVMQFFVPGMVFRNHPEGIEIVRQAPGMPTGDFWTAPVREDKKPPMPGGLVLKPRLSKDKYLETIEKLRDHIRRGDCYEINFCQEFFAENVVVDAVDIFRQLVARSPNPFSAFYQAGESSLMCASPERFLARRGNTLISQPIKGTSPRAIDNPQRDAALRSQLQTSAKERSENVMVVDLVRNDLSVICEAGTVEVNELFGIYSYPQVHQMISTISGKQKAGISFAEILGALFPMGSMTGAPKQRVMQLIDAYEPSRRGLFSGSVGYFAPNGDFDFNVVIRSLLYNAHSGYLSYQVGSGITWYCNPQDEYEECMLKAEAIRKILE